MSNPVAEETLCQDLEVMVALCQHIDPKIPQGGQHPVVLLLEQSMPLLETIFAQWFRSEAVVATAMKILTAALKIQMELVAPLLPRMLGYTSTSFLRFNHPSASLIVYLCLALCCIHTRRSSTARCFPALLRSNSFHCSDEDN